MLTNELTDALIAGLDPAIHDHPPRLNAVRLVLLRCFMDARVKPAHDGALQKRDLRQNRAEQ